MREPKPTSECWKSTPPSRQGPTRSCIKASLSLDTYGHLFVDFDHRKRVDAQAVIRAARKAVVPAMHPRPMKLAS